jgi:hypothetical protein
MAEQELINRLEEMHRRIWRIYVDTSVFGGVFEDDKAEACSDFFRKAAAGVYRACISQEVIDELEQAPFVVRRF